MSAVERYVPAAPGDVEPLARWARVLVPASELARQIADTDFVPDAMRGNPAMITAAIMYGDELGIGPMQALASINVIKGTPAPSAHLLRALIYRAGHSFLVHESTGTRCKVSGLRAGRPESERTFVEWTLDMARSAGLLSSSGWQRYPRSMLLARATAELARALFPDVMKGLALPADDGEIPPWDAAPDEIPVPAKKTVQRRRKRVTRDDDPPPIIPDSTPVPASVDVELPPDVLDAAGFGSGTAQAPDVAPPVAPPGRDARAPGNGPQTGAQPTRDPWPPIPEQRSEPPVEPRPISDHIRRALFAALADAGISTDDDAREYRLAFYAAVTGRDIASTGELTRHEALRIIGTCADVQNGVALIGHDADGGMRIMAADEPPPEEP